MKKAVIKRKTEETDIEVVLELGAKKRPLKKDIKTPSGFLNHMLEEFACHGGFSLKVKAKGDTEVDMHHTVEDAGICLGEAVRKIAAQGNINRFGSAVIPMDEALALVASDVSGRPFLDFKVKFRNIRKADFDYRLFEDFFRAFSTRAGVTLHIISLSGRDNHHISESIFKAFGKALSAALAPSRTKTLSTKGVIG